MARQGVHGGAAYRRGKQGQATKEEFRNIAQTCRDAVRKAKAHIKVMLTGNSKSNQKSCFCCISRKMLNEWSPWLNRVIDLVTVNTD